MKKSWIIFPVIFCLAIFLLLIPKPGEIYDASMYGVLPGNSGSENSKNLQALIDKAAFKGGTIYIPEGEYVFCANGSQTYGDHCIKMRSNVSIHGSGEDTVLMPAGESEYGLDMFYYNDYLDHDSEAYLENCQFRDFVIDASGTSCKTYTSAGKGFMFNLFRNCHWANVTVKYTDATGFGVDCPVDSSMTNCVAIGCGKAAAEDSNGASGFGIGYGFAPGENLQITDCTANGNKKFGFFFEHQGRFDLERYPLENQGSFEINSCSAEGNLYNFGGICAQNVTYQDCVSEAPRNKGVFFEDCTDCRYNGKEVEPFA